MWAVSPDARAPIVEGQRLRLTALGAQPAVSSGRDGVWPEDRASKSGFLSALRRKGAGSTALRRTAAAVAIVACAMTAIAARKPIVRAAPAAARVFAAIGLPVNLRGL